MLHYDTLNRPAQTGGVEKVSGKSPAEIRNIFRSEKLAGLLPGYLGVIFFGKMPVCLKGGLVFGKESGKYYTFSSAYQ